MVKLNMWVSSRPGPRFFALSQASTTSEFLESLVAKLAENQKIVLVVDAVDESEEIQNVT